MSRKTPPHLRDQFARNIRRLRLAYECETGKAMAELIGVDQNTYTSWERDKKIPYWGQLEMIRKATGATVDWLVFGDTGTLPPSLLSLLSKRSKPAA